jgi:hypothetical protein
MTGLQQDTGNGKSMKAIVKPKQIGYFSYIGSKA